MFKQENSKISETENNENSLVSNGIKLEQASIKEKLFFSTIFGFVSGVLFSSFLKLPDSFFLLIFLISFSFFSYAFFIKEKRIRNIFVVASVFLILFGLGILRYEAKDSFFIDQTLKSQEGETVSLRGVAVTESEYRESYLHTVLEISQYNVSGEWQNSSGKILIRTELFPEIFYGDEIEVDGVLKLPEKFETESGRIFDYEAYLSKDDIGLILNFGKVKILSRGNGNFLKENLLSFKRKFVLNIEKSLPEPFSALMNGILLGVKSSLGKDLEDDLRKTAIIHIVVLSGYNITLVAQFVMKSLFFLNRKRALLASIVGIILFAIMVGGEPSVARASLMGILALIARGTGRRYDITRALLLAGFFMAIWNPKVLVFDLGFQLSFIATMALIWLAPIFEEKLKIFSEKFELRGIASATISTQIFVLPLLLYHIGEISIVGVFVNLLILPIVPFIMFFGFLSGALGFLSYVLAFPFSAISHLLLFYTLKVVEFFASLPIASFQISKFPFIFTILLYSALAFLIFKITKIKRISNF